MFAVLISIDESHVCVFECVYVCVCVRACACCAHEYR